MDGKVTEVRMQEWFEHIQAWKASGLSKVQWCAEKNISERRFYYWQKRIREKLYGDMTSGKEMVMTVRKPELLEIASPDLPASSFAEIPLTPVETKNPDQFCPEVVVKAGGVRVELSEHAARSLLESIGEAIRHAM